MSKVVPDDREARVFYEDARVMRGSRIRVVLWLLGLTLAWKVVECSVSLAAALSAHSPVLLAFGSDSLVELVSAAVVLFQFTPRFTLAEHHAHRAAAVLLIVLVGIVAGTSVYSLRSAYAPDVSRAGILITAASLAVMPGIAWLKRLEARRLHNAALAADAVQSATCSYLALIALAGLGANAIFHVGQLDSFAAFLCLPFLLREAWLAWRGDGCGHRSPHRHPSV